MRPIHRPLFWLASALWLAGCGDPLPQAVQVELLPKLSVEVETPQVTEGETAKFIIRLSEPVSWPVGLCFATEQDSASSDDFSGILRTCIDGETPSQFINPGDDWYRVEVAVTDDSLHEGEEQFRLALFSGTRVQIDPEARVATVTILDNDPPATLELADRIPATQTILENAGQIRLAFKLYNADTPERLLSPGLDITVPLQYSGDAIRGQDFDGPDEITLKKNENLDEFDIVIELIDDITPGEPDKTLEITLGTPDEAVLGTRIQTTLTLLDDDGNGRLNDSGLTRCQNDSEILPCPVASHPGQDGDQDTPMRFSLYSVGDDECIVDETTGLMWERESRIDTYTWYNTIDNINGGDAGTNSSGTNCSPPTNCTTSAYIEAVNQANNGAGLCGFTDWRLPKLHELLSLVHYDPPCSRTDSNGQCSKWEATIDLTAFPLTVPYYYWSASPSAYKPDEAWAVNFADGRFTTRLKREWGHLRAVRRIRPGDLPP